MQNAWDEQSPERREKLLKLLLDRVRNYMGLNQQKHDFKPAISIPNRYKDRIDDLEALEAAEREETEGAEGAEGIVSGF